MGLSRSLGLAALACVAAATAKGCGGSVQTVDTAGAGGASGGSGPVSTAGPGSTSGSGGASTNGDCSSDAECRAGKCVELTPGGWRVCSYVPPEASACTMPPPPQPEACCTSADCVGGKCYANVLLGYCGGPAIPPQNYCIPDGCTSDDACIHDNPDPWICIPAGVYGDPTTQCLTAFCKTNADCGAQPGGVCRPVMNPCCGTSLGLACVYPGGCWRQEDCGEDAHCEIDAATGRSVCVPGNEPCPV
jgi:hypothetical protein